MEQNKIRIFQRTLDPTSRPIVTVGDILLCIQLPIIFIISRMPERLWSPFCLLMEAIKRSYSSNKNRLHEEKIRKALSLDRNSAVPQHIRVAGDANRTEHSIQIFREYGRSAWTPPIRIEGINYLKDVVSKQKGVVLWASHFAFSSLITKKALAAAGYSVSHLSRPEHGFSKSRFGIAWLNPFRCAVEDRYLVQRVLIQRDVPGGAFQSALEILSHGGAVSVTAGAWEGRILAEGDFLAGKIHLAIGAELHPVPKTPS